MDTRSKTAPRGREACVQGTGLGLDFGVGILTWDQHERSTERALRLGCCMSRSRPGSQRDGHSQNWRLSQLSFLPYDEHLRCARHGARCFAGNRPGGCHGSLFAVEEVERPRSHEFPGQIQALPSLLLFLWSLFKYPLLR